MTATHPIDRMKEIESAFQRHAQIAFQFSGGRDSLCALHYLRPYWERMTVYHLDTGNRFPETRAVVERVAAAVPSFVSIAGRTAQVHQKYGMPSDLVPTTATNMGRLISGTSLRVIDRHDCCWHSLMLPLHERMAQDGITLIVRGQRDADYKTPPFRSGGSADGFEVLYPIQHFSDQDVMDALESMGVAPARFYEHGMTSTPDCMTCTAFWDEKRAQYLRNYHPAEFKQYRLKLKKLASEITPLIAQMQSELIEMQGD